MKKIIPKMNFNREDFKKILFKALCCKRLLFMIFFGALLIFTFDIVYRYAFLNVEYVDYMEDDSFIITDGKINNINLNRVLKNVNKDGEKVKIEIDKEYKDPFSFNDSEPLNEVDKNESEKIYNSSLENSENSDVEKDNESNSVIILEP